jgi:hypothetical protein
MKGDTYGNSITRTVKKADFERKKSETKEIALEIQSE